MRKLLLAWGCLWCITAAAQDQQVTGTIVDNVTGEPLIGATVVEKGTFNGTTTDLNGQFSVTVSSDTARLILNFIGYLPQEISTGSATPLSVKLVPDPLLLNEVVVTALGMERERKALGYSVQKIESKSLTQVRESNLVNSLSGRAAGVQVTNGSTGIGSSSRVVIRGETSLSGSNQALFVVDGFPISNELITNNTENDATGFQEVDYGNGAADISPDDIESISILKGPGATALYGSRAANGVVVITTKAGKPNQGLGISINSSVTFEQALRLPEYQNQYGQGTGGLFAYEDGLNGGINDGGIVSWGAPLNGQLITQFDGPSTDINGNPVRGADVIARNGNPITPTAWTARPDNVKDFFETGITFQNNVAISGANDEGHFRLSYSRLDNEGIIPNTDLERNGIALSGGYKLNDRLTARTYLNFIRTGSDNRAATGYGSENPMYTFTWMGRQVDVDALKDYWQAGQEDLSQFNYNYAWMDNPYFTLNENTNGFRKDRVLGNMSLDYRVTDHLSLRFRNGLDTYHDLRESRRAFSSQRFRNGAYREDEVDFRELNTDLSATYARDLSKEWSVSISAGGNRMDQETAYQSTTAGELSVPGIYNFGNSRIPLVVTQYEEKRRINSLYSLGQVAFRSSIFLDLTLRNDWSSTLPDGNNSYAYYSASASAIISDLVTLPKLLSFAKVRLSAASVGNDTDPYSLNNTYVFGQPYGSTPTVSGSTTLLNDQLKPERQTAIEIGTDLRFFLNRIGLDVTYYNTQSSDQIIELPTSSASGFESRVVNGGKIQSEGIEVVLNLVPVKTKNFSWNSAFNFSRSVSTVKKLPDGIDQYVTGAARVYDRSDRSVFFIATEGGRVGDMYGTGLLTVDGQHVYDANGNPVKDPELRKLGNYNPDFILGFSNNFSYKNFDFGFLFDWRQGGTIVSRTKAIASTSGALKSTLEGREGGVVGEGVVNVGTESEPVYVTNTTSIGAQDYYNQFFDRDNEANALYDATYVKLREIRIGYTLPEKWVKKARFSNVRVSVIAKNVAVWTENPHFDPELATMQGRSFAYGVEDMSLPSSRSFGIGLSVNI